MTWFPNCREKISTSSAFSRNEPPHANPYWDGFLKGDDKTFVAGYDTAADEIKTFTYNLETFADEFAEATGISVGVADSLLFDISNGNNDGVTELMQKYQRECNIIKWALESTRSWIEGTRNQMITAMIDDQTANELDGKTATEALHDQTPEVAPHKDAVSTDAYDDDTLGQVRFFLYEYKEEIAAKEKEIYRSDAPQEVKDAQIELLVEHLSRLESLINIIEEHIE